MFIRVTALAAAAGLEVAAGSIAITGDFTASATPLCSGAYLCAYFDQAQETISWKAYANTTAFTGHFEEVSPSGTFNTADARNNPGPNNISILSTEGAVDGTYCFTAWHRNGPNNYTAIGHFCRNMTYPVTE